MTLRSILDALRSIPRARGATGRRPPFRPRIEPLDDRRLPSFSPAAHYAVGAGPQAVATADFNGDGTLDLVTVGYSGTASVLLGDGLGGFGPAAEFPAGSDSVSVAVGDFDDDGNLDLATANPGGGFVGVVLGHGDGTFGTVTAVPLSDGSSPQSVAVGDFNADGTLDLGVASNAYFPSYYYWGYYGDYSGSAHVLVGDGAGGFSDASSTGLGYGFCSAAAAADFDGDGIDDLAVANRDAGSVVVLTGNGAGDLVWLTESSVGGSPYAVTAADVTGDGRLDLLTANASTDGVGVLAGNGLGGFGAVQVFGTGSWPTAVAVADFNHDGTPDVATANSAAVSVLLGRGGGTFTPPISSDAGAYPAAVVAGDFDGDGWADAATANSSGAGTSVLLNDHAWPDASAPSVSINDVTVTEGNAESLTVTFTLTLSAPADRSVTVHFSTANGTATAGTDYAAASGTVTIPAGVTTKTFTVAVLGDRLPEATETFTVNLDGPTNAFIADGQGVVTILDNEPRVSVSNVTLAEGDGGGKNATTLFTFTVSLSVAYDQPVTMSFRTADGSAAAGQDYVSKTGTLTFAPGETTKTVTIEVKRDNKKEANETFYLDLFGLSGNALFAKSRGVGTILNDD